MHVITEEQLLLRHCDESSQVDVAQKQQVSFLPPSDSYCSTVIGQSLLKHLSERFMDLYVFQRAISCKRFVWCLINNC